MPVVWVREPSVCTTLSLPDLNRPDKADQDNERERQKPGEPGACVPAENEMRDRRRDSTANKGLDELHADNHRSVLHHTFPPQADIAPDKRRLAALADGLVRIALGRLPLRVVKGLRLGHAVAVYDNAPSRKRPDTARGMLPRLAENVLFPLWRT